MRIAIALGDAGHDGAIDGVTLLRSIDGDPERPLVLFKHHATIVSHCLARSPVYPTSISDRMAADCKDDLGCRNRSGGDLPDPDLVVVECSTADRRDRLGSGEHVDPATANVGPVRVHRLSNQDAATNAIEYPRGQRGLASDIAERDSVAILDRKGGRIFGM